MAEIALIPVIAAVILLALGQWWTGPHPKGGPIDADKAFRAGGQLLIDIGDANAEVFERRQREFHTPHTH